MAAGAVTLLVLVLAPSARANAPVKDGWWTETNTGLGVSAVPAQVPAGGLYVENGFNGPVAISALSFDVPAGATVGQMTLAVTGNPVLTSPPVACELTTTGEAFKPAEGGKWSDRPAYDCSQGKVTATVASNKSSVTFAVGALLHNGVIAVAVLAGGPADQIAFAKPGSSTLAVSQAGSATAGAPAPPPVPSVPPTAPPAFIPGTAVSTPPSNPITSPATTSSASGPSLASPAPSNASTSSAAPAPAGNAAAGVRSSLARSTSSNAGKAGAILGAIGLVGLLVAYTEGYGLLGGRIRPLARLQSSRRRAAYRAK
jgi:hypothetical protein